MERRAEQAYGGRRHEPTPQGEKDDMATWPYRELVGALTWLALGTRPDIAFATSSLLDSVITWAAFTGTLRSAYYVTSREPGGGDLGSAARAIALARNLVFHDRSKHIDIQYQFTRGLAKAGKIDLTYVPTKEMLADVLTKPLPRPQHEYLAHGVGLL